MAENANTPMRNPGIPNSVQNSMMMGPQSIRPPSSTMNPPPTILNSQPTIQPQNPAASTVPHFAAAAAGQFQMQSQPFMQNSAQSQAVHHQFHLQAPQTMMHPQIHVNSPSNSTPVSAAAKRSQQKPPARPVSGPSAAAAAAALNAAQKTAELTAAAKRKKRKLPEKQLPDRVAALLPESALYTQLLEFEMRVDAALSRKKIDIQEALKNPPAIQRTLRIYIFNTYMNQNRPPLERQPGEVPSWSLKIIGRVLEDGNEVDHSRPNYTYPKFSHFFKRITIVLSPELYPENHQIVWDNVRSSVPHEGFEVRRVGDKEFSVSIRLEMSYSPERFKLSPALMEVLGIEVDTRPRIIAAVWHYVKARKLQNPSDPSFFVCDQPLRKVFGEEKVKFTAVSQKISPHLSPPQPIYLEHRLKLSGNNPSANACYDILVDVPFQLQKEMAAFLANTEKHKEIDACDEAISNAIKKIHEHRKRRAFFLGFSQSPVEFINQLIASQSRDLKLIAGESSRNSEKERRADFYNQPWVEDAVIRYLNRKPAGGNDTPGTN